MLKHLNKVTLTLNITVLVSSSNTIHFVCQLMPEMSDLIYKSLGLISDLMLIQLLSIT